MVLLAGCGGTAERPGSEAAENVSTGERAAGVEVIGLRRSAGGYMLDFRYRVVDPERAGRFMDESKKPYLLDPETGTKLIVPAPPKIGSLRQTSRSAAPVAGRVYFMLFANPGGILKAGDVVTVVVDDLRIENLTVE